MQKRESLLVASICAIIPIIGLSGSEARADHQGVVQAWAAAWNSGNPDAFAALFTDDALLEHVPFGSADRGTAQIRAFYELVFTAMPDLKMQVLNSNVKGGRVTIEWLFAATDGLYQTGKPFSVRGVTVIDLRGTTVARDSDYWDLATIFRQVGLLPPGL
jgi:steroid delta-isomerase-like uncharacterized protein